MGWYGFKPYVSVAKRRAQAQRKLAQMAKQGHVASPVEIAGRQIATTFWGRAWCDHLESYSDFENRLPRGRTYVRNGSVVDLKIEPAQITALVSGSELYEVGIRIKPLDPAAWKAVQSQCAGRIGSLVELLQGRLSDDVMGVVTHRDNGLFPKPKQIEMKCSCPDWAGMCKHVAAVLYGVGARLDRQPELLFTLRKVDHRALISSVGSLARSARPASRGKRDAIAAENLADVFGIEIDSGASSAADSGEETPVPKSRRASRSRAANSPAVKAQAANSRTPAARAKRSAGANGSSKNQMTEGILAAAELFRARAAAKRRTSKAAASKPARRNQPAATALPTSSIARTPLKDDIAHYESAISQGIAKKTPPKKAVNKQAVKKQRVNKSTRGIK